MELIDLLSDEELKALDYSEEYIELVREAREAQREVYGNQLMHDLAVEGPLLILIF